MAGDAPTNAIDSLARVLLAINCGDLLFARNTLANQSTELQNDPSLRILICAFAGESLDPPANPDLSTLHNLAIYHAFRAELQPMHCAILAALNIASSPAQRLGIAADGLELSVLTGSNHFLSIYAGVAAARLGVKYQEIICDHKAAEEYLKGLLLLEPLPMTEARLLLLASEHLLQRHPELSQQGIVKLEEQGWPDADVILRCRAALVKWQLELLSSQELQQIVTTAPAGVRSFFAPLPTMAAIANQLTADASTISGGSIAACLNPLAKISAARFHALWLRHPALFDQFFSRLIQWATARGNTDTAFRAIQIATARELVEDIRSAKARQEMEKLQTQIGNMDGKSREALAPLVLSILDSSNQIPPRNMAAIQRKLAKLR